MSGLRDFGAQSAKLYPGIVCDSSLTDTTASLRLIANYGSKLLALFILMAIHRWERLLAAKLEQTTMADLETSDLSCSLGDEGRAGGLIALAEHHRHWAAQGRFFLEGCDT
jgi:hypothetical protein